MIQLFYGYAYIFHMKYTKAWQAVLPNAGKLQVTNNAYTLNRTHVTSDGNTGSSQALKLSWQHQCDAKLTFLKHC